jgi:hypothetical protein
MIFRKFSWYKWEGKSIPRRACWGAPGGPKNICPFMKFIGVIRLVQNISLFFKGLPLKKKKQGIHSTLSNILPFISCGVMRVLLSIGKCLTLEGLLSCSCRHSCGTLNHLTYHVFQPYFPNCLLRGQPCETNISKLKRQPLSSLCLLSHSLASANHTEKGRFEGFRTPSCGSLIMHKKNDSGQPWPREIRLSAIFTADAQRQ